MCLGNSGNSPALINLNPHRYWIFHTDTPSYMPIHLKPRHKFGILSFTESGIVNERNLHVSFPAYADSHFSIGLLVDWVLYLERAENKVTLFVCV